MEMVAHLSDGVENYHPEIQTAIEAAGTVPVWARILVLEIPTEENDEFHDRLVLAFALQGPDISVVECLFVGPQVVFLVLAFC